MRITSDEDEFNLMEFFRQTMNWNSTVGMQLSRTVESCIVNIQPQTKPKTHIRPQVTPQKQHRFYPKTPNFKLVNRPTGKTF